MTNTSNMTPRQLRRAAERTQRKADRQAGLPNNATAAAPPLQGVTENLNRQAQAAPPPPPISEARQAASRENGSHSQGPKTTETRATSAQIHTTHGLARHINGTFKLLTSEDPAGFEAFKHSLTKEHSPTTETECLLLNTIAESHWLADRAQRLQNTCLHPDTGEIANDKKFSLYLRYETTHRRAFYKALTELKKLHVESRKADLGFEAEAEKKHEKFRKTLKEEAEDEGFAWDNFRKEAAARFQVAMNLTQYLQAKSQFTNYDADLEAALTELGLPMQQKEPMAQAA